VAESVLFLLLEIERAMRPACGLPALLLASGGLSKSDALCARLADLAQRPVEQSSESEATARGLAWLVRGSDFEGPAAAGRRFEPRSATRLLQRHARWRAALDAALRERH
jgi:glycerol kinase